MSEGVTSRTAFRVVKYTGAPNNPQEGDVYENTTTHQLYFYDGTTFQAAGGGGGNVDSTILRAVSSSDFNKTDNTLADVTGLSLTLVSSQTYIIEAYLFCDVNNGSAQISLSGTTTVTSLIADVTFPDIDNFVLDGATRLSSLNSVAASSGIYPSPTAVGISISGSVLVNVGGTLTIKFSQVTTNPLASLVLAGSWLRATKK